MEKKSSPETEPWTLKVLKVRKREGTQNGDREGAAIDIEGENPRECGVPGAKLRYCNEEGVRNHRVKCR